jgi:lysophospholipase L1-like esterase
LITGTLLALPPLWVAQVHASTWLTLGEQLYLTRSPPWDLALAGTIAAGVPLAIWIASHLPTALPASSVQKPGLSTAIAGPWALAIAGTWWAGDPSFDALPFSILGLIFLGLPAWLAWRSPLSGGALFLRDLPALAAVAWFGWQLGFAVALIWRLAWLMASARTLLDQAPKPAADYAFVLLLCIPLIAESALRGTYLAQGWHPAHMSLDMGSDGSALDADPSWAGQCGQGDKSHTVVFVGGSSTGGVLQFRSQSELFFPGRVHARLCEGLAPGHRLNTYNYGRGAVDTHVIARSFEPVMDRLKPQVVVMYVGVNDLLSRFKTLTRRQREEKMANMRGGRRRFTGLSRLVTGLGLLGRSPEKNSKEYVQDVPTSDALLNHQILAEQTAERGTSLLLITEYLRRDTAGGAKTSGAEFEGYAAMQRSVASNHAHTHYLDVWPTLRLEPDEKILIDSNHLTRYGSNRLGELLTPVVAGLAGIPYDGLENRDPM